MNKFLQKGDTLQVIGASFSLSEPVVCHSLINPVGMDFHLTDERFKLFPLYGNECIQDTIQSLAHLSQKHAAHLDFLEGVTACFRAVIKLKFDFIIEYLNTKKQAYFNVLLEALVCLSVPRGNHRPEPNGAFTIVRLCLSFLCPVQETSRPKSLTFYSGTAVSLCQLRLTVRKGHKNFFWLKVDQKCRLTTHS